MARARLPGDVALGWPRDGCSGRRPLLHAPGVRAQANQAAGGAGRRRAGDRPARRGGGGLEPRAHEIATIRSIGTRAGSAISAGTLTSYTSSRSALRNLGSVIIF